MKLDKSMYLDESRVGRPEKSPGPLKGGNYDGARMAAPPLGAGGRRLLGD